MLADGNLDLLRRMRAGEFPDGTHILRARIDMAAANINLRDPAIYRIRHATHHNTGDKWCIYPMYTYAHPLEDALEQITLDIEDGLRGHRAMKDEVNGIKVVFADQRSQIVPKMLNDLICHGGGGLGAIVHTRDDVPVIVCGEFEHAAEW